MMMTSYDQCYNGTDDDGKNHYNNDDDDEGDESGDDDCDIYIYIYE